MNYFLKNKKLTIQIDPLGAELTSIRENQSDREYLWNADAKYWKRHSPVLFPFVGALKNKSYSYHGISYSMNQHGFARDMSFIMERQSEDEIWFSLQATDETLKAYPFHFRLETGYQLHENTVTVKWKVINMDNSIMYFSIGAHPAFNCPINSDEIQSEYFLSFDSDKPIRYQHIDENGLLNKLPLKQQPTLLPDHGIIPLNPHMFDHDALIIEDRQCHSVSLLTPEKVPYITVTFDAPLFGLWTPSGKAAPFLCIEPWYGRCDADTFDGTLEEREWSNVLSSGEVFEASYKIKIE